MKHKIYISYFVSSCVLLALPWLMTLANAFPFLLFTLLLVGVMAFRDIPGYSLITISICLCRPVIFMTGADENMVAGTFYLLHYFIFAFPMLLAIINILKHRSFPFIAPIVLSLIFIAIGVIYGDQVFNQLYSVVCIHLFFYVCYYDKLSIKETFLGLTVLFTITAIYAALEYHLHFCPYSMIYLTSSSYDSVYSIGRAVGLLGNPLILCCVATFYLVTVLNSNFRGEKINMVLICLSIYILLIVTSRTSIAVLVGIMVIFLYLSQMYKSPKRLFLIVSFALCMILAAQYYLPDVIDNLVYRMMYSERSHRQSGLETCLNILADQPFGLGAKNFGQKVLAYAAAGKEEGINTLDNFFLSQIAYYGILGIIVIYYYLYYFFVALRKWKYDKVFSYQIGLYALAFCLIGFSFDLESYPHLNIVLYGILGLTFGYYSRINETIE